MAHRPARRLASEQETNGNVRTQTQGKGDCVPHLGNCALNDPHTPPSLPPIKKEERRKKKERELLVAVRVSPSHAVPCCRDQRNPFEEESEGGKTWTFLRRLINRIQHL
jgi:hypothetical protein